MVLTLWVCRDPEINGNSPYTFYDCIDDMRKFSYLLGGKELRWYWDRKNVLWTLSSGDKVALLMEKAGLSLAPGEGPKKVRITIEEVG